jgi:hypothetical protein
VGGLRLHSWDPFVRTPFAPIAFKHDPRRTRLCDLKHDTNDTNEQAPKWVRPTLVNAKATSRPRVNNPVVYSNTE